MLGLVALALGPYQHVLRPSDTFWTIRTIGTMNSHICSLRLESHTVTALQSKTSPIHFIYEGYTSSRSTGMLSAYKALLPCDSRGMKKERTPENKNSEAATYSGAVPPA